MSPSDYELLKQAGYDVAVVDFGADDSTKWQEALGAAAKAQIKLIAGIYPPPFQKGSDGRWTIVPRGIDFLNTLRDHSEAVFAVFGFNEPYDSDPRTGKEYECGYYSAADLRSLRTQIRTVWAEAKIYHDLDDPTAWAPGSDYWQNHRACIGDKYKDQSEVADYVGIWSYPFLAGKGYTRDDSLRSIRSQVGYVNQSMKPAQAVVLGQAFASKSLGYYFPSKTEIKDWNCALRRLNVDYVFWYPWRQEDKYDDFLAKHADYLPLTLPSAC